MGPRLKTIAALLVCLGAASCEKTESKSDGSSAAVPADRVGVVDLDKVATDLGWMREMQTNLSTLQQQLATDMNKLRELYDSQIQAKQKEFMPKGTEKLTQQQQEVLMQMVTSGRQTLGQVQVNANQQFQSYRADWVRQYREALAPVVRQVANERRIGLVINKTSESVLYNDAVVELTNAIVDAARSRPPQLHPVPVPSLQAPASLNVPGLTTQPLTPETGPSTTKPATRGSD